MFADQVFRNNQKGADNSLTGSALAMARGDGLSSEVGGVITPCLGIRNLKLLFHELKLLVIFLGLYFPHGIVILLAYLPQLL